MFLFNIAREGHIAPHISQTDLNKTYRTTMAIQKNKINNKRRELTQKQPRGQREKCK